MKCVKCNRNMEDGELICKNCGYEAPLMEARGRLEFVKEKQRNAVLSAAKSSLFFGMTICFSIMTLAASIMAIMGNLVAVLPVIFMIISAVGYWKMFVSKDNASLAESLKTASIFDVYNRVIFMLVGVVTLVAASAASIAMFVIMGKGEMSDLREILKIGGIASLAAGILVSGIVLLFALAFDNRRKYFTSLSTYADSMDYTHKKAPQFGSWIIGIFSMIGGLGSILVSLKSAAIINLVSSLMDKVGEIVKIPSAELVFSVIDTMLLAFTSGLVFLGISLLANGIYYISSAIWMSRVHTAIMATRSFVNHEQVRRLELERSTKEERERRMQNSECRMQNSECRMQNEKAVEMQNAECRMQNDEATVGASIARPSDEPEPVKKAEAEVVIESHEPKKFELEKSPVIKKKSNPDSVYDDDDDYYDILDLEG